MGALFSSVFETNTYDWSPSPDTVGILCEVIKKNNEEISDVGCLLTAITISNSNRLNLMRVFNGKKDISYGLKEVLNNNMEGFSIMGLTPKMTMNQALEFDKVFRYLNEKSRSLKQ